MYSGLTCVSASIACTQYSFNLFVNVVRFVGLVRHIFKLRDTGTGCATFFRYSPCLWAPLVVSLSVCLK
jgi:hypothetical protein